MWSQQSDAAPPTLRLLVVEDHPGDVRLLEKHLENIDPRLFDVDHEVYHAERLEEAVEMVDRHDFDLVFLDLGLPDSRGVDTFEQLHRHASRLPIVLLTASPEGTVFRAIEAGARDFISKEDLDDKRLARALCYAVERKRRKLHRDVIQSANVAMLLTRLTEMAPSIIFANDACTDLTGHSRRQWREHGLSTLEGELTDTDWKKRLRNVAETGRSDTIQQQSYRHDGSVFWCEIDVVPVSDNDGRTTHLLMLLEDVTDEVERRAKLAEYDRMNTLWTVADGVAHEINNPLAFMLSNVEVAHHQLEQYARGDATELGIDNLLEALDEALLGGRRVKEVVDDLAQLAERPDDLQLDLETLDVRDVVDASLTMIRNKIKDRGSLVCQLDEDLPMVVADRSKLGQVVLNVLTNAVQALPEDQPQSNEVRISVFQRAANVVIAIRDTGSGIPESVVDRIFEPFVSTKKSSEGTGLGLSIAKQIVERFDGTIEVESTSAEGTTVEIMVPAAEEPPAPD